MAKGTLMTLQPLYVSQKLQPQKLPLGDLGWQGAFNSRAEKVLLLVLGFGDFLFRAS